MYFGLQSDLSEGSPDFFTGAGASLRGCRGHFRKVVKRATLCHTSFCSLSHLEGAVIHRFNESEILWPTGHSKISLSLPPSFSSLISLLFSLSLLFRGIAKARPYLTDSCSRTHPGWTLGGPRELTNLHRGVGRCAHPFGVCVASYNAAVLVG